MRVKDREVNYRCPQCHGFLRSADWKGQVRCCRSCDITVPTDLRFTVLEEFDGVVH